VKKPNVTLSRTNGCFFSIIFIFPCGLRKEQFKPVFALGRQERFLAKRNAKKQALKACYRCQEECSIKPRRREHHFPPPVLLGVEMTQEQETVRQNLWRRKKAA